LVLDLRDGADHQFNINPDLKGHIRAAWRRRGAQRAQIEAVRVHERFRRTGLGSALFECAIEAARSQGCALVQLTSEATRSTNLRPT
jgi:GNAT superfamily N-acetyltransferase